MIKRPIFLVINSQLFLLYNFSKFLYFFTLFIHPSTLNITNKTPHTPDDGSAELKRYSVDWLCFSINPYFLFGLHVVNFSSQIVALCLPLALNSASCPQLAPTPTDSSRLCPGYIFVWRSPASTVLSLIYTGASLDWRPGRGSICNNFCYKPIPKYRFYINEKKIRK